MECCRGSLAINTTGLKEKRDAVRIANACLHVIKFFNRISGASNDRNSNLNAKVDANRELVIVHRLLNVLLGVWFRGGVKIATAISVGLWSIRSRDDPANWYVRVEVNAIAERNLHTKNAMDAGHIRSR